jgi:hypothetical protein
MKERVKIFISDGKEMTPCSKTCRSLDAYRKFCVKYNKQLVSIFDKVRMREEFLRCPKCEEVKGVLSQYKNRLLDNTE